MLFRSTFKEYKVKKVVSTCAHCFNTLRNEYKQFGIELEVVHHTQLLNRLVREGKLTPVATGAEIARLVSAAKAAGRGSVLVYVQRRNNGSFIPLQIGD